MLLFYRLSLGCVHHSITTTAHSNVLCTIYMHTYCTIVFVSPQPLNIPPLSPLSSLLSPLPFPTPRHVSFRSLRYSLIALSPPKLVWLSQFTEVSHGMSKNQYTLFTDAGNFRAFKALIAAQYNNVDVKIPDFTIGKDKSPHPQGKLPVLQTSNGTNITESNAIARFIAKLRVDTELLGSTLVDSALVTTKSRHSFTSTAP